MLNLAAYDSGRRDFAHAVSSFESRRRAQNRPGAVARRNDGAGDFAHPTPAASAARTGCKASVPWVDCPSHEFKIGLDVEEGKIKRFLTSIVLAVAALSAAPASRAQDSQNWKWCSLEVYTGFEQRISACSDIIRAGGDPPAKLPYAYCNRGSAYQQHGDLDKAIADYDEVVKLDPVSHLSYVCRAHGHQARRQFDQAIDDYNRAIALNPRSTDAFVGRGIAYRSKGEYDRAIADYTDAIRLDSVYVPAFRNRALAYHYKADHDRAIADYTEAIRLDPRFALAFSNRGLEYYIKRDYDHAIADYTEAIRLDPKLAPAFLQRSATYRATGNLKRASEDYAEAVRLEPRVVRANQASEKRQGTRSRGAR
jgi:tetratricopeptide (TPR) repeat protein